MIKSDPLRELLRDADLPARCPAADQIVANVRRRAARRRAIRPMIATAVLLVAGAGIALMRAPAKSSESGSVQMALAPTDDLPRLTMTAILNRQRNDDAAIHSRPIDGLTRLNLESDETSRFLLALADNSMRQGDRQSAADDYRRICRAFPASPAADAASARLKQLTQ